MILSMTGFARRETTGPWGTLACELRTVNHRFLETGLRLPEELRGLDPELRRAFSEALRRGKVDCVLSYRTAQGTERALEIDPEALGRVLARVREVSASLAQGACVVDALEVLRWPGVLRNESTGNEVLLAAARELVAATLTDLVAARSREGVRLRELIEQRCTTLASLVEQVRARLPEVQTRIRARLEERLAELAAPVDRDRLEQELALMLQRLDVDEELDRLSAHIEEVVSVLARAQPAGRRLDFLMQELNREANTLSSKSQDLNTTRVAVDMKVAIEQMREQVQNVE